MVTNWNSKLQRAISSDEHPLLTDRKEVRLLPFDILFNKLQPIGTMLSAQLRYLHTGTRGEAFKEDGELDGPTVPYVWLFDYISHVNVSATAVAGTQRVRKINDIQLLLNNTLLSPWNNNHLETAVACRLNTEYTLNPNDNQLRPDAGMDGAQTTDVPIDEDAYTADLIHMKQDLYQSFANQMLVRAGNGVPGTQLITNAGDSYISDYTHHAYGKLDAWDEDQGNAGRPERGIRVIRRYLCEMVSNLTARYEINGNPYSRYYPKSVIGAANNKENYFLQLYRTTDPNQFGYSSAFNALPDLLQSNVFAVNTDPVTKYPFRIHRTGKLSRQNKYRSWRTLLPLDYYEMPRTFGPVMRLQGYNDKLLINMLRAFYITIGNVNLITDNMSIALTSGDIFRVEPEELLPDQTGIGGLQDELAAVLTPMGYAWYDAEAGIPFLYSDKLVSIANFMYWFFQSLPKLQFHNPYWSEGVHMGWDPYFRRLLLSWRKKLPTNLPVLEDGVSLIMNNEYLYKGMVVKYIGITTGCTSTPGCTVPVITRTTPDINARTFADSYIPVLGFDVTAGAQVSLSVNSEYYKDLVSTSGGQDHYILYHRPATNLSYNSAVTIIAINNCGVDTDTHTVAITAAGGGGGGTGVGILWPDACYAVLQVDACGAAQGVWTASTVTTLTTGVALYTDQFLLNPLLGYLFFRDNLGLIWNLVDNVIDTPVMAGESQAAC